MLPLNPPLLHSTLGSVINPPMQNTIEIGVSADLLLTEKKRAPKNDSWNFWIWVLFVQKWPFRDALFFKNWYVETLIFIVFWGCALSGPSCQKKGIFGQDEKLISGYFLVCFGGLSCYFSLFFSFLFFVFVFLCFSVFWFALFLEGLRVRWGGPKGHLTWP